MNVRSYLKQHLRQNLLTFIIVSAICCLVCFIFTIGNQAKQHIRYPEYTRYTVYDPTLTMSVLVLCIMCLIAPVLEFHTFKQRKNLDFWFAMPISKQELGFVHHLTGYLLVVIPFTVCYLQNFIMLLSCGAATDRFLLPLVPHYLLCLLLGFVMYSVCAFVFNRASSVVDGIFTMVLWTSALFIAAFAVYIMLDDKFNLLRIDSDALLNMWLFTPVINVTSAARNTIVGRGTTFQLVSFFQNNAHLFPFILWLVLGFAGAAGNIFAHGSARVETVQDHSNSFFCYRVLIPLYVFSAISILYTSTNIAIRPFISVIALIGYIIYRRGFRFKLSDGIVMTLIGIYSLLPLS